MSITDKQLAVGRVRGIRRFRVNPDGALCGQTMRSYRWSAGENVAVCKRYPSKGPLSARGSMRTNLPSLPHHAAVGSLAWQAITAQFSAMQAQFSQSQLHPGGVVASLPEIQDYPADMNLNCKCGFYSYKDQPTFGLGGVVGIIDGWGKTIVGDNGYRTEKAKIVALVLPTNSRSQVINRDNAQLASSILFAFAAMSTFLESDQWAVGIAFMTMSAIWIATWWYSIKYVQVTIVHPYDSPHESAITPSEAAKVRKRYPDVPIYNTIEEAKQAHPLGELTA